MDSDRRIEAAPTRDQEIDTYFELVWDALGPVKRIELSDQESSKWLEGQPRMSDQEFIDRFMKSNWIDLCDKTYRGGHGGTFTSWQVAALVEVIESHVIDSVSGFLMDGGIDLRELMDKARAKAGARASDASREPARKLVIKFAQEAISVNPRITDPRLAREVLGRMLNSTDGIAALNKAGYTVDETSRFGETAIKELIKRATRDGRITGRKPSRSTEWRRRNAKK